jgi:hypothetical protein
VRGLQKLSLIKPAHPSGDGRNQRNDAIHEVLLQSAGNRNPSGVSDLGACGHDADRHADCNCDADRHADFVGDCDATGYADSDRFANDATDRLADTDRVTDDHADRDTDGVADRYSEVFADRVTDGYADRVAGRRRLPLPGG